MNKEQKSITKEDEESVKSLVTLTQRLPEEVKSYEEAVVVTDVLVNIKNEFERLEDQRKRYTAPMNEAIDRINSDVKELTGPLKVLERKFKEKIETYANTNKKELLQEAKAAGASKNELALVDTSQRIQSDLGEIRFRTEYSIKITNKSLIPEEFFIVDEDAIIAKIKAGEKVPGVKVIENYKASVYKSK